MMKSWAANIAQARILRYANGKIGQKEKEYLAFVGLDDSDIRIIKEQFKKHGRKDGQAYISGLSNWDDTRAVNNAARKYKAALRLEADTAIVTKGVSDTPLVMHGPMGSLIFQFKSFLFASHQRMIMRGMQQADAAALSGALMMVAGGMMTAAIKQQEYRVSAELQNRDTYFGQPVEDWSRGKWLAEGIDRSGLGGLLWEGNNIYEKSGGYGFSQMLGAPPASRFASRNIAGSMFGPTIGTASDLATAVGVINAPLTDRDVSESDTNALRRIIPMQNLIGVRFLFDAAQGKLNE